MSDACNGCADKGNCSPEEQSSCQGPKEPIDEMGVLVKKNLGRIKHKLVVLSGKGGVGKSTVSANLAVALAMAGKKVGLMDVDIHGPSIPRLLSLSGVTPHVEQDYVEPVPWDRNLWVMSMGFMLPSQDQAVIWRGPVKMGVIRQFLGTVAWGDLDYLVVDCPPGTGDEPLTVLQELGQGAYAVVVTTPQMLSIDDVRRSLSFVRELGNPILGVIENMSGYTCPSCGATHDTFNSGAGQRMAQETGVPFLGRIPFDPEMARAGDEGFSYKKVFPDSPTSKAMDEIIAPILELDA